MNICVLESRFGYDCEDRRPCKYETSQKSPDVLFDSVLIIQFSTEPRWHLGGRCYLFLMRGSRRGQRIRTPPPENHKSIGFFSTTGPDPLKNHMTSKPASTLGHLPFRLRADDGPLKMLLGSSIPSSTKKQQNKKKKRF